MSRIGDLLATLFVGLVLIVWLYYRFRRWLEAPVRVRLPVPEAAPFTRNEAVHLLEDAGYEVVCGRVKVPVLVEVDDEPLEVASRLFVDFFARKDHELYLVKVSRARRPMEWTASGLRDRLMMYHWLFKETHGILYVDLEEKRVRKIRFDLGETEIPQ
jgi:hypothetical protein